METITLYRVTTDGKTVVTPNEPESYDSTLYRLVAADGKELVKDGVRTPCIDTESVDGWIEEDAQEDESTSTADEQLAQIKEVYANEI